MAHENLPPSEQHTPTTPPFHPDTDAALLRSITLHPDAVTPDWVETFNQQLEIGFVPMSPMATVGERQKMLAVRETALDMIGLQEAAHPLNSAFLAIRKKGKPVPPNLFSTLKALVPFGDPVSILRNTNRLWGVSDKNIKRRTEYMGRVARVLAWQGEQEDGTPKTPEAHTHELICEYPQLLLYDRKKLAVFVRIAADFGEASHREWSRKSVVRFVTFRQVEAHIAGIAYRDDYELGLRSGGRISGKHQYGEGLRQEICAAVADPAFVETVGRPVLRAYFRANPPSAKVQAESPAVRQFLPLKGCRAGKGLREIHTLQLPTLITGKEEWLKEMSVLPPNSPKNRARRKQLLDTLNWHAVLGSRPLHGGAAERVSSEYRLVTRHRTAFLSMLGWTDPSHPLYNRLKTLQRQRRNALIPPRRIIHVLNALALRGVNPVIPVLDNNFQIVEYAPEPLHKKLDIYESFGLDINERLQQTAWPLRLGADALTAYLAREAERREAKE